MITTTIDYKGYEEGVIVTVGGMTGSFAMFMKGGRLYYDYNYLDGVFYTLSSPRSKGVRTNYRPISSRPKSLTEPGSST